MGSVKKAIIIASVTLTIGCAQSVESIVKSYRYTEAPMYEPLVGNKYAIPLAKLIQRMEEVGMTVETATMNGFGLNDRQNGHIYLSDQLSVDGQFEVLTHEAGHMFHPPMYETGPKEIFAELVGMGVQEYYGSKTARKASSYYLVQHKHAFVYYPRMKADIDYAVKVLVGLKPWPKMMLQERPQIFQ